MNIIYFDVNPLRWKTSIALDTTSLLKHFVKSVEMRFLEMQFVAMCNVGTPYFLLTVKLCSKISLISGNKENGKKKSHFFLSYLNNIFSSVFIVIRFLSELQMR